MEPKQQSADLRGAIFNEAALTAGKLLGADLRSAYLADTELSRFDLSNDSAPMARPCWPKWKC